MLARIDRDRRPPEGLATPLVPRLISRPGISAPGATVIESRLSLGSRAAARSRAFFSRSAWLATRAAAAASRNAAQALAVCPFFSKQSAR